MKTVNTQKGVENLQKQPFRSALKGNREAAKEEAMKIGDALRKKATPQERRNEDREFTKQMSQNARLKRGKQAKGV